MPRYFLNVRDGDHLIEDFEGAEFFDLESARSEALAAARDLLAERLRRGLVFDGQIFEIRDETGGLLATVPFTDAVRWRD